MKTADPLPANRADSRSHETPQSLSAARKQAARGARAPRVLAAEDDAEMRAVSRIRLIKHGYSVTECRNGVDLLNHLGSFLIPADQRPAGHEDFNAIISNIWMPGASGLEILVGMAGSCNLSPVVLITAFGDKQTHVEAIRPGAVAVFDKPFDVDELLAKTDEITHSRMDSHLGVASSLRRPER